MLFTLSKTKTPYPLQTAAIDSLPSKPFIAALSEPGYRKQCNEDSILVKSAATPLGHCMLLAVADGVGGLYRGEEASGMAIKRLEQWWNSNFYEIVYKEIGNINYLISESLSAAIYGINNSIFNAADDKGKKMGTTLSLVLIINTTYYIKHVGDSRIYLYNGRLQQVTEDHSLIAQFRKNRTLQNKEALSPSMSNVLTKCVGVNKHLEVDEGILGAGHRDVILLCTDGLYKCLDQGELNKVLKECRNDFTRGQGCLMRIFEMIRLRGETDDISAILVIMNPAITKLWVGSKWFWHGGSV